MSYPIIIKYLLLCQCEIEFFIYNELAQHLMWTIFGLSIALAYKKNLLASINNFFSSILSCPRIK